MAFFWNYSLKLDDKGRITIPSDYKNALEKEYHTNNLAVVHGVVKQKCLVIYPYQVWIQKLKKLIEQNTVKQDARKVLTLRRYLTTNTYKKELDKNGKLLIPPRLWNKIDVEKIRGGLEMVIVGNFDSFEVWLSNTWEEYQKQEMSVYKEGVTPEEFVDLDPEALFYLGKDDDKDTQ